MQEVASILINRDLGELLDFNFYQPHQEQSADIELPTVACRELGLESEKFDVDKLYIITSQPRDHIQGTLLVR